MPPQPRPIAERFWPKVKANLETGCWEWTGANANGYGVIYDHTLKRHNRAPFISLQLAGVDVPTDKEIDHLCRNPSCVNPKHLEVVSHRENVLRGVGPTAENSKKSHCKYGHPFNAENTQHRERLDSSHGRRCRACNRIAQAQPKVLAQRRERRAAVSALAQMEG